MAQLKHLLLTWLSLALALSVLSVLSATGGRTSASAAPEVRTLRLRAGESTEVQFPLGTDISISRRGIVDAFHLGEGRWQLTGLHAGFVVVDAHDATTNEASWPRLMIDVVAAGDQPDAAAPPPAVPPWICATPGITCELPAGIVRGATDSYLWFQRAHSACTAAPGCLFAAQLRPSAQEQWLTQLRAALGDAYQVSASGSGQPLLTVYCGKAGRDRRREEADQLTGRALSSGLIWLRCQEDTGFCRYRLRLRLYALDTTALDELGLATQSDVQLALPASAGNRATLLGRLALLAEQHRAEMVGEPVFRLTPNQQAELSSGGEFQVVEHVIRENRDDEIAERVDWKQHGLVVKVTASPISATRVRLTYDMSFKSRAGQGSQATQNGAALSINSLKSEIDIALGVPVMAGLLDLHGRDDAEQNIPYVARLPIIGPLLTHRQKQSSQMRLLLWLQLDADDPAGALAPETIGPPALEVQP